MPQNNFCSSLVVVIILLVNLLIINYIKIRKKSPVNALKIGVEPSSKYILVTILITTLFIGLPLLGNIMDGPELKIILVNPVSRLIINVYALVGIVNIVSLFTYSQKGTVINSCDCSESWERTFIYYYSMVVMSIYIFTGAILLLVILHWFR